MNQPAEAVRDFLLHLEKAVALRRLYAANSPHYQEVLPRLLERLLPAAGYEGFTVRLTAREVLLDKQPLLQRSDPEESFFFPLYRDGVRELSFTSAVTEEELEALLAVMEAGRRRRMGPEEDAVVLLWQSGLDGIGFRAIDGIGDQEAGEEDGKNEYGTLAGRLTEQLRAPNGVATAPAVAAESEGAPSYGLVIDADLRIADGDVHYDAATVRRTFAEHPRVLRLTAEEVAGLRAEVTDEDERRLLDRFLEILLAMALDAAGAVPAESVAPVLEQVVQGLWSAGDLAGLADALGRLQHAAENAPSPDARRALRAAVDSFFTPERVARTAALVRSGELTFEAAAALWEIAGDSSWSPLLAFWGSLPSGALAAPVEQRQRRPRQVGLGGLEARPQGRHDLLGRLRLRPHDLGDRLALDLRSDDLHEALAVAVLVLRRAELRREGIDELEGEGDLVLRDHDGLRHREAGGGRISSWYRRRFRTSIPSRGRIDTSCSFLQRIARPIATLFVRCSTWRNSSHGFTLASVGPR